MTEKELLELLLEKVDCLDKKVDHLDKKVDHLDKKVDHIELVLENEIRPNQKLLAEGFVLLNEKIEKQMSVIQDINFQVRLNILESEVEKLKLKIS